MKSNIIFRADGGSQIGLGHIMRCLALAEMLKDDFEISFAIQNPDEKIKELISQIGFKSFFFLPQTTDFQQDVQNLITITNSVNDKVFILDGYNFQSAYQQKLKQHCKKLIYIDDLFAWHQYADIVINHSGVVKEQNYKIEPYTKLLLGTKYALIRNDFWQYSSYKKLEFPFQKILVNLGGADSNNNSYKIIENLFDLNHSFEITLLLGAANKHINTFKKFQHDNLIILQNISSQRVAQTISHCDIAIVSCSTIAYEVSIVGKPFIGVITADNQVVYKDYFKQSLAIDVIEPKSFSTSLFEQLLANRAKAESTVENQKINFSQSNLKSTLIQLL